MACFGTPASMWPVVREGGLRVVVAANSFALLPRPHLDSQLLREGGRVADRLLAGKALADVRRRAAALRGAGFEERDERLGLVARVRRAEGEDGVGEIRTRDGAQQRARVVGRG